MDKKKVGIVTFHTADNYGALYQCYALQETIKNITNYNVEIIDYCTKKHIYAYKLLRKRSTNPLKNIVRNLNVLLKYKPLREKQLKFKAFRQKYLMLSNKRYHSEIEFLSSAMPYHICVTGSDQVFQPYIEDYKAFYMDFDNYSGKKVAYAPSFGISDFSSEVEERVQPLVMDYDHLSCREEDGAAFLTRLTGKTVPVVLDPVFLLSPFKWRELCSQVTSESAPYIFIYDLNGGSQLVKVAKKIQKKINLPIICATSNSSLKDKGVRFSLNLGPLDMINMIDNASYVITDSFHGAAMSLCLNKKVIVKVANKVASSRLLSLFNQLNISNQIINDDCQFDEGNIYFNSYAQQLEKLKTSSLNYLKKSLE